MHIIRTELTSLAVRHYLRVSISNLSRVIKKKTRWPWMTLPGITDDVRINLSRIFAYYYDRVLHMEYNGLIRMPLRAIVPEIFAKKRLFMIKKKCNFWNIFIITQKVIKISTWNFVNPKIGIISRVHVDNFLIIVKLTYAKYPLLTYLRDTYLRHIRFEIIYSPH